MNDSMISLSTISVYIYQIYMGLGILGVLVALRKLAANSYKIYQLMYGKYQERTLTISEEELSKCMDRWKTRLIREGEFDSMKIHYLSTTARLGIEEAMQKARTKVWAVKL